MKWQTCDMKSNDGPGSAKRCHRQHVFSDNKLSFKCAVRYNNLVRLEQIIWHFHQRHLRRLVLIVRWFYDMV